MISELPEKGRAERIVVSLGPGSFTGVRIGLAAARALGLAWEAEVLGYPTLALVAAMAHETHPGPVTVCMTGGHGEWFVQHFEPDGSPFGKIHSLPPVLADTVSAHTVVAGSCAEAMAVADEHDHIVLDLLPDARKFHRIHESLLTADLAPIYGRPPDARLPA